MQWVETSDYPAGRLTGEVRVAPVRDDRGHCTHLVGSVHDISERMRAESAIRESEERFRNIADTAPVLSWVSSPDKLFSFVNRGWLLFTGSTMKQAIGNGWLEKVHPDDRDGCYADYCSAFDARHTFQTECRLRRADGEYRCMLTIGNPRFESLAPSLDSLERVRTSATSSAIRNNPWRGRSWKVSAFWPAESPTISRSAGQRYGKSELVLSELPHGSPAAQGDESIRAVAGRAARLCDR